MSRMGMSGFGGMGQFGGAFLLVNALSGKIYELIAESTQTIVKGYEQGGLIGLIQSDELRALLRRYLWLISVAFAFERLRWLWTFLNGFRSVTRCTTIPPQSTLILDIMADLRNLSCSLVHRCDFADW
jgi:hypothetical protein